jgi:hypothetical protein
MGCCAGCFGCWWMHVVGYVFGVLCFFVVLCGFVLDFGILVLILPRCIDDCRVPGLHCAGGLIGTWFICLSTVSFLLRLWAVGAYGIIGRRAVDYTVGLVRYLGILPRVMLISYA